MIDESAPFTKDRDVYTVSKIEAEKIVWQYHREHGLPVVVFRPTLIYGPYGRMWTVRIVEEIQSGAILVNGGSGTANLIYVDNLIDAILLAMGKDSGDGEAFNLVDDEHPTWQDVYKSYADMMSSHPPLRSLSAEEIEAMRKASKASALESWVLNPVLLVPEIVKCPLQSPEIKNKMEKIPWIEFLTKLVPRHIKDRIKGEGERDGTAPADTTQSSRVRLPGKDMVELYASQSHFSNEKVKKVLGYTQRIPFDEAMNLTRSWLRYQRLIP